MSAGSAPRLVLIPGLGADGRMFDDLRSSFTIHTPDWLEPRAGEALASYAARLAETMPTGAPLYIGGASMGGMLALEMAGRLRPRGVLLIGSCRSPDAVRPLLRRFERRMRALPGPAAAAARLALAPALLYFLGPMRLSHARRFWRMNRAIAASFVRWGARAIMEWPGLPDPGVPVHHIHGALDRMIPAARVRPDALVEGAGHVLAITHPREVARFITERAPDLEAPARPHA